MKTRLSQVPMADNVYDSIIESKEKWQFCPDQECSYCSKFIMDEMVKTQDVVTHCPYCNRSFVD